MPSLFEKMPRTSAAVFAGTAFQLVACGAEVDDPAIERHDQTIINADGIGDRGGHAVAVSRSGSSGVCSGTLIRNDVVLTAQHCVAPGEVITVRGFDANGSLTGSSVTSTEVLEVQLCRHVPGLCPPERDQDKIVDVALVKLSSPLPLDGDTKNGFRALYLDDDETLIGDAMICQGRGATVCGGGATNRNRWGRFVMSSISVDRAHWDAASLEGNDPFITGGDSGGGCYRSEYSTALLRPQIAAVYTNSDKTPPCTGDFRGEPLDIIRPWVRAKLGEWGGYVFRSFDSASELNEWSFYDPPGAPSGPSSWSISSGALEESSNIGGGSIPGDGAHALFDAEILANGCVATKIYSSDDDWGGILFGYEGPDRHYRFAAREPSTVQLVRVRNGVLLASEASHSFDWSNGVKLELCRREQELIGYVDGTEVVRRRDTWYPDGRVGVFNRALSPARFTYFAVEHDDTIYVNFDD